MEKNYQFLKMDINKPINRKLTAIQYDNKSRYILVNVFSNFMPYDLTYATVKVYGIKKDKTVFFNNAKILDAKNGKFEIDLTEQCLAVNGDVEIQIIILGANKERLSSNSFILNVKKSIIEPLKITSQDEWGALTEGLASLSEYEIYKNKLIDHDLVLKKHDTQIKNIDTEIETNMNKENVKNYVTNFRNKKDAFYSLKSVSVLGDSISQGFNSSDFYKNSWTGIMRNLINAEYNVENNLGYVSFITSNKDIHEISRSGNWTDGANGDAVSLYSWASNDINGILKANLKIKQKYLNINYTVDTNGGLIDIYTNGVKRTTIDTSVGAGRSDTISLDGYSFPCLIEFRKTDSKNTKLNGAWYLNEEPSNTVVYNNYSRSGAKLVDITDNALKKMCDANIVFFALGHNDCYSNSVDIADFKSKINYVINTIKANGAFLVVLDFIWKYKITNEFRQELMRLANEVPYSVYIQPAKMFNFNNDTMISKGFFESSSDTSHPTNFGHKFIAELTAKTIRLSKTNKSISNSDEWHYVGDSSEVKFENNWVNTFPSNAKYKTKFRKINNSVQLEIYVNGGTKDASIFTLPKGYRPNFTNSYIIKIEASDNNVLFASIEIREDGKVYLKSNYSYTNYNCTISFPID